ncbi:MAG: glycoside hydrolase family 127 protein [Micrococcales bacterium]|nr:glycoside hydrolase family 127 protein [Micrococcales bacterium]
MTITTAAVLPVQPSTGVRRPLGLESVRITGGFWERMQRVNAANTLPHIRHWLEREGWLANFDLAAAGTLPERRHGREFADSEVYKYLEAVSWELGRADDAALEADFRSVVTRVAAAQDPDGYLSTAFGRPGQRPRWSDLEWGHELYCLGHLFQAAVARIRTRPDADDGIAAVARRAADLVCEVFGAHGIQSVCGHPEVETALVELGRATGERRYVEQARIFVERRGTHVLADPVWGREYWQDDVPVLQATVLRGHAVRANYSASGAADVAAETGDAALLSAVRTQWATTVARRTYVTGGQGSHHSDEAFGADFELPPDRAYSETCAGVASVQLSWRLLLAEPDGESTAALGDLIERTLFNVVATSPSSDGRAFFYTNTLQQRDPGAVPDADAASSRAQSSLRAPWFDVSCCPPNVARTLASLAAYVATADERGVQLYQYAPARVSTLTGDRTAVELEVATAYPASGNVSVRVLQDAEFTLSLRVPAWAEGAMLDGAPVPPGIAQVRRAFRAGDIVVLELPVRARVVHPDPRIDPVRGSVTVERGPEVLCLESVDLEAAGLGTDLAGVALDPASVRDEGGRVAARLTRTSYSDDGWPYGPRADAHHSESAEVALIPYHDWAERGPSTMRVWIPSTVAPSTAD